MRQLNQTALLIALFLMNATMIGCGTAAKECADGTVQSSGVCPSDSTTSSTNPNKNKTTNMGAVGDYLSFVGYISPLNISVNGKEYVDSEDFYTHEVQRLRDESAVTYPDYSLRFDANVGLRDFKKNMAVFLVASNDTGVASESNVDSAGKFSFNLLGDSVSVDDIYTLRATKRISVRLVKGKEEIRMCYNLYAEAEVTLTKSVILRSFATSSTEYNCVPSAEGIQLPRKANNMPVDQNADNNVPEVAPVDVNVEPTTVPSASEEVK